MEWLHSPLILGSLLIDMRSYFTESINGIAEYAKSGSFMIVTGINICFELAKL
jgi:hypothetical protein